MTRIVASGKARSRADEVRPLGGTWTVVFPATYCVHLMEEYGCGESFYRWVSRVADVAFTRRDFVTLNLAALAVMSFGAWLAARHARMQWLVATLGVIVAFNGFLHLVASAATWSYSPGLISGMGLWVPVGAHALRRAYRQLPRLRFAGAVALGAVAHGVVSLLVLTR